MDNEVTPEQYKMELMKRNFANRIADYEEALANVQTQLAMANQRLRQYEADESASESAKQQVADPLPPPEIEGA